MACQQRSILKRLKYFEVPVLVVHLMCCFMLFVPDSCTHTHAHPNTRTQNTHIHACTHVHTHVHIHANTRQAVPYDELVKASNPYGLCVHMSESGDVIRTWHDARAHTLAFTSHCSMHGDHMFVGSFVSRGIGKLKLSKSLPQNAGN